MPWGVAAAVGGAFVSSTISGNAAKDAAKTQAGASEAANDTQKYFYDTTRSDNMPALQARNSSLARMQELLGTGGNTGAEGYGSFGKAPTSAEVMATPGYQFGLDQGTTALNRQAAARGSYNSGAALKAASRYGTDYATTKYDNALNNQQALQTNTFNRLASVAGAGQTGASAINGAGANAANGISANQTALGNALGASQLSQANGWTSAINQSVGALNNWSNTSNSNSNALSGSGWTGGANSNGYLPNGDYVGGMS